MSNPWGNPWVFSAENPHYPRQKHFLDLFYNDKVFFEKYLKELNNYSNNQYILNLVEENRSEFEEVKKILKLNFPTEEIFVEENFRKVSTFIQNTLKPIQKPYFNLLKISNNILELKVTNTQILPIEITGITLDEKFLNLQSSSFVNGLDINKKKFQKIVKINCLTLECNNENLDKIKINYRILGQKNIFSNIIKFWNNEVNLDSFNYNENEISLLLDKYKFIEEVDNNLIIDNQEWKINERIVTIR